ncbi:MAG: type II secretion system protein [Patescibacteria group bacterium]|jgi:prepilin-type N-terminal cleavage/methylation domain-containing protein
MKIQIKKILNKKAAGYSLMEMVVVLAVFSMTALMAVNLFVTITNIQRQVRNVQAVQSDARFVMESVIREAQIGTIDYEFYRGHCEGTAGEGIDNYISCESNSDCAGNSCVSIDLSNGPADILVTRDQENKQVLYRLNGQDMEVCSNSSFYRNRCSVNDNWQVVTPEKVIVTGFSLYIFPFSDPYSTKTSCTVGLDCDSGICTNNFCEIPDIQPMVTIIMNSSAGEGIEQEEVKLQTTVTSMVFRR